MRAGHLTIGYNAPFFEEAAQYLWNHYGSNPCAWRQTLVLAPNIRSCQSLREALVRLMPSPAFCPRIISFKNMPDHLGMIHNAQPWPAPQQVAFLFDLLNTPSPIQRLEQAKSWQRQMDELARNANTILDKVGFDDVFRPLWPGVWSNDLYDVYEKSPAMLLRTQSQEIWQTWRPDSPVVVVGSTGSTVVSHGWLQWAQNYRDGFVIQRGNKDTSITAHIVQVPQMRVAATWLADQIEETLDESGGVLTVVSPQSFDALNQQLLVRGIAVDRGEYANFRDTPVGQFWACLMRLLAEEEPSPLLLWECFKRVGVDATLLIEAELRCRKENTAFDIVHLKFWDYIKKKPSITSLDQWWAYIRGFITLMQEDFSHPILDDVQSWPTDLSVFNVQSVAASLLSYIDAWWPIPLYRFVRAEKPRVQWVGPWEARGLVSDHVWVCGLNEGVWPGNPQIEPWLFPHERVALGLPDAAHFEKLSYHDLACTLGSASAHITWVTLANQPPSRWIVGKHFQEIRPNIVPPAPLDTPPVGIMRAPIDEISVTEAERLMRDPYAYYVRAVLRLQPLDALLEDDQPQRTAKDKGLLFHKVMQLCALNKPWGGVLSETSVVDFFWKHQIQAFLPHITWADSMLCEVSYNLNIGNKKLVGRLDRVDMEPFVIINYKTGSLPSMDAITQGHRPQLALETLLAAKKHHKDEGQSILLGLKHVPDDRQWTWTSDDLQIVAHAFGQWLDQISAFPAHGAPGMDHIERTDTWRI